MVYITKKALVVTWGIAGFLLGVSILLGVALIASHRPIFGFQLATPKEREVIQQVDAARSDAKAVGFAFDSVSPAVQVYIAQTEPNVRRELMSVWKGRESDLEALVRLSVKMTREEFLGLLDAVKREAEKGTGTL